MKDRLRYRAWVPSKQKHCDVLYINYHFQYVVVVVDDFHNTFNVAWNHCVIEQCTGLKDKNGRLIYEGDIVKFKNDISEVKWCINGFAIDDGIQYLVEDMDIEVIGNIHENPELAEEEA